MSVLPGDHLSLPSSPIQLVSRMPHEVRFAYVVGDLRSLQLCRVVVVVNRIPVERVLGS